MTVVTEVGGDTPVATFLASGAVVSCDASVVVDGALFGGRCKPGFL